jgi:uncharacterized protein (TIGR00266 family)
MEAFVRGQKTKLAALTSAKQVQVGLRAQSLSQGYDVSCFGLDAQGRLSDDRYFVFFNQPRSPEGAIEMQGGGAGDNEVFAVDLARLPDKIAELVFVITVDGDGTLSQLAEGHLRLMDASGELARFEFSGADFSSERAVMVGRLYNKGEWRFAAVGQGFAGGLEGVLEHFGGVAAESSSPASSPEPAQTPQNPPTPAPSPSSPPTPQPSLSGPSSPPQEQSVIHGGATSSKMQSFQARTSGTTDNRSGGQDDVVDYTIFGDDMQMVEIELDPGEAVRAEAGAMMYMSEGIEMETNMGGDNRRGGGGGGLGQALFGGLKRVLAGESFFITNFTYNGSGPKGHVSFGAPYPGKIIPLELARYGGAFMCQKDAFLCAARGVEVEVAFTRRIGAGFFGGEGFILQRLEGDGRAFIHAGGAIVMRELEAGETLRVDTGCLVAFAPSVDYDIQFMGGFRNALFGGEGLFLAKLTGPGLVFLQSLPFSRLADRVFAAARSGKGEQTGVGGSGLLGGLISGDR